MNAMRHLISGSDAAEDDDIPRCVRCGALVEDPCDSDDKEAGCELPDFCFPSRPTNAKEGDFWIIEDEGRQEHWRRYTNGKWEKYLRAEHKMTDSEDSLVRRLRQFQADEPGFPPLFSHAAAEIERLKREILRCDDACYGRDKEIAELQKSLRIAREALERIKYGKTHVDAIAEEALQKLRDLQ